MKLRSINWFTSRSKWRYLAIGLVSLAWFCFGSGLAQTNNAKRILSLHMTDAQEGARVTIVADFALNDYEALRRGDKFYVKFPATKLSTSQPHFRGHGFEDVQVQRNGDSIILSFKLQPGASARVDQRFNRLNVVFSSLARSSVPGTNGSRTGEQTAVTSQANRARRAADAAGPLPPNSTGNVEKGSSVGVAQNTPQQATASKDAWVTSPAANANTTEGTQPNPNAAPPSSTSFPASPESPINSAASSASPQAISSVSTPLVASAQTRFRQWVKTNWRWLVPVVAVVLVAGLLLAGLRRRNRRAANSGRWLGEKISPSVTAGLDSQSAAMSEIREGIVRVGGTVISAPRAPSPASVSSLQAEKPEKQSPAVSVSHSPEVKESIVEPPFLNTPGQIEQAEFELKNLLAGRDYDARLVDVSDPSTRQVVATALMTALAGRNSEQRDRARKAFIEHGYFDETTRDLRTADSPAERAAAARKLGAVGDSRGTTHLVAALYDTSPEVRRACVESLGQIGDPAALSPLNELLQRENSRQLPEAVIRHAINSITVTEVKRSTPERTALRVVEKTEPERGVESREFMDFVDALKREDIQRDEQGVVAPVIPSVQPVVSVSTSASQFSEEELRLELEEQALRRAAEELEQRRLAAETARLKAEEEARLKAEMEAQARAEIEARLRAEEEARRRAEEEAALRRKAEEEARVRIEQEARLRAEDEARTRAEEEERFRIEAETLRRAAEELARKRADAEMARKLAEEEARKRAEEAARRAAVEDEAKRRVEEERRRQIELEVRHRLEEEARQRAEEEARRQAEEEARQRMVEEARVRAEEEGRRQAEEEVRQRIAEEARVREEEEVRGLAEQQINHREQASELLRQAEERRRREEERFLQEQQALLRAADEVARRRRDIEEARKKAEEEARLLVAAQERIRIEEESRRQAEEERQRLEAEARNRAEEERQRFDEARRRAIEEQKRIEDETRRQAEEEEHRLAELELLRQKAEEQSRKRAEQEQRIRAEIEALHRAEEEQRQKIEAETRRRAEAESRLREEKARRQAEEEARIKAEREARLAEDARIREEEETRRRGEEEARIRAERESRQRAEEEARRREEEVERQRIEREARLRAEHEAQRRGEEETRLRAEEEARQRGEQEARRRAEEERAQEEARRRYEAEARKREEEESARRREQVVRETEQKSTTADHSWVGLEVKHESGAPVTVTPEPAISGQSSEGDKGIDVVHADKGITPVEEDSDVSSNLLQRLSSDVPVERAAALNDIARSGSEDAFRLISQAFDDPSPDVRNSAARSLYDLQADRAASFTRALREGTPERQRKIGAALAASGLASEAIANLTGESRDKTYDAFSLLFLMAKAGEVQPLLTAIEDYPDIDVRLAVVKLLALSGQAEIVPAFRRLAVRGSLPSEVRSAVMEAIYQISSQSRETAPSAA